MTSSLGTLGRFELLGLLGQGGMGAVYEAYDRTLDRKVAVKQLHDQAARRHRERLLREAQVLARLSHPNVVQVYDVGEADGTLFIAMELVGGHTLRAWQREAHDWRTCLEVYLQAARGLAAAHAEGIVHRDFKPANCILDDKGRVRVLDFGLARGLGGEGEDPASGDGAADLVGTRSLDSMSGGGSSSAMSRTEMSSGSASSASMGRLSQQLTMAGAMLGTPAYMAPEQSQRKDVDARCDQYSLCVSLYEALYGERPYDGVTGRIQLFAGIPPSFAPKETHAKQPRVPKWLRKVLLRGLAMKPDDRFGSMDALIADVERRWRGQRRLQLGVAGLGLGLVVAWGGAVAFREAPCEGIRDAPMPAWASEQRAGVEQALLATSSPLAESAWESVHGVLDAYAEQWVEARAQTCEATRVERSMSEEVLDLRLACLDRRALHMSAMVEQLSKADAVVVAHAGQAVRSLPPLDGCVDLELLHSGPKPLPEHLLEKADDVRRSMAESWAAGVSGRTNQGLMMAELAVLDAEELGEEGLQLAAEARLNRGRMFRYAQRIPDARADLELVVELAEQTEDQALALDALRDLVTSASAADDLISAAAWMPMIRGKLRRFPDRPRYEADRRMLEGLIAVGEGKGEEAAASLEQAVEIYRTLGTAASAELSHALIQLGRVYRELLHRPEQAQQVLEEAASLAESEGLFPVVIMVGDQLAYLYRDQGRMERAEATARGALQLVEQIHGPDAPGTIPVLVLLAELAELRGEPEAARELLERAQASLGPQVPAIHRFYAHNQRALLHLNQGDPAKALEGFRQARQALNEVPSPDQVRVAMLDSEIGDCLMFLDKLESAKESYQRALTTFDIHLPEDDSRRVYPLVGLGHVLVQQGQLERGIPLLRRAWEIEQRHPRDPGLAALIESELATAIVRSGTRDPGELTRARALLEAASAYFQEIEESESVEELQGILDECGSRCANVVIQEANP